MESFIPENSEDSQGQVSKPDLYKELQGTTELLLTIANSMPIPLIVSSLADGTILYSNDLCRQAFGFTAFKSIDGETVGADETFDVKLVGTEVVRVVLACPPAVAVKGDGSLELLEDFHVRAVHAGAVACGAPDGARGGLDGPAPCP